MLAVALAAQEPQALHRRGLGRLAWALGIDVIDMGLALAPAKQAAKATGPLVAGDHGESDPLPCCRPVAALRRRQTVIVAGAGREAVTGGQRAELGDSSRHSTTLP
jgi:hypothetical protein